MGGESTRRPKSDRGRDRDANSRNNRPRIPLINRTGIKTAASDNVIETIVKPISFDPFIRIVGTFAVMTMMGYTLDNLSMMALILSIGFVVDDAIVMLENIVRHLEMGEAPLLAAMNGSKEIGFTIVSMTLSLAAVFIPVLFMSGILGRLFREFAVTITAAILISGVVSVTLTPMLCSRFLKPLHQRRPGPLFRATERVFDGMLDLYDHSLQFVLRHRASTVALSLVSWWLPDFFLSGFQKDSFPIRTMINCLFRPKPSRVFLSTR